MSTDIEERANFILEQLNRDNRLKVFVDATKPVPKPFRGKGEIKLIVLGQDPTIKNAGNRNTIKTVLNLDRNRSARAYLSGVCNKIGLSIDNVYATNLYKNFFANPPTEIKEIDIFEEFLNAWLPLLTDEIKRFGAIPVITLGQPILSRLVNIGVPDSLRYYWGHANDWKVGKSYPFRYIKHQENKLQRIIFPFPHQTTRQMKFYKARMNDYVLFMKTAIF